MIAICIFILHSCLFLPGFTAAEEKKNEIKRLLVNDPDVIQQLAELRKEVTLLTSTLSATQAELSQLKANQGGTSARFAAGNNYNQASTRGGPANMLCLPSDPELSNITSKAFDSFLFGTEYEENILRTDARNEDVPCAVCKSLNTISSIMIPGRRTCYTGWKHEYNGFIVSDYYGYSASSYICLDKDIQYVPGGQADMNGRLLHFTSTKCGSLSCPPYKDDVLVYCVVCSK